jgi:UDP-4-amino-4,6-dideoxy-N-acetyl-beta-L-altrosamine transaminase
MIPYGRQQIDDEDVAAVVAALTSDFLTQGPRVPAFEEAVAARVGAAHAVAVNSATSALHIACLALGIGPGDRVWTSPISFVASANCVLYCGAQVDFVDIDPATYNMSPAALEAKLVAAEQSGTLPKAVIPVHLAGQSCDMAAIGALAQRYGFAVIEDASHAIGASFDGRPVGDCSQSAITVFSFHPVKIVTTAEGGVATTNDPELAKQMALLRTHGVTRDPADMAVKDGGAFHYEQLALGYNYRMTELHAALGLSQLAKLDPFVERRRTLAASYDEALSGLPLTRPAQDPRSQSSWHLYIVQVEERRRVFDALRAAGIGVSMHYPPIYLQPYYRALGFSSGLCPVAEAYAARAISLPLHPGLSADEQERVVSALGDALAEG